MESLLGEIIFFEADPYDKDIAPCLEYRVCYSKFLLPKRYYIFSKMIVIGFTRDVPPSLCKRVEFLGSSGG